MHTNRNWKKLFGIPPRNSESNLNQSYMNLALAIQTVTEEMVLKLVKTTVKISNCKNLVLAGGVALNCVANGKILENNLVDNLWIQPASGDAGGSVGAAYCAYHIGLNKDRPERNKDQMKGTYLGPKYTSTEIELLKYRYNAQMSLETRSEIYNKTAQFLTEGKVVGWFQGRMEFGPRALGRRSILADPRNPEMQKKVNLKIKYREGFRPFAPSILEEDCARFFDIKEKSPYMLLVAPVKNSICYELPKNYHSLSLFEKLYHQRSDLPAITHVDFSARIQTVSKESNEEFWHLLNKFKEKTETPVLINTSFNVRGEPIVCTPDDAFQCFMTTEMDVLVIENYIFIKEEQNNVINIKEKKYVMD